MNVFAVKYVSCLLALLSILAPYSLRAQGLEADGLSEENRIGLDFARRLASMGMNDYAKRVTDRLKDLPPNILDVMEAKNLCALKKFDQVKAIIRRQADPNSESTWVLKCTLADGYYAWGKYPEAQGIYESFFKKYPDGPPDNIKAFFRRSAYKYAQMLINMGANERAINAYAQAAKTIDPKTLDPDDKATYRQLQGERAELMLTVADANPDKRAELFPKITKLAGDLMWIQDLWFGKSIVMLAHIHKLSGEPGKAIALVDKYTKQLKDYDAILKESSTDGVDFTKLSPMAQCRYMLGTIQLEKAEALIAAGDLDGAYERLVGTEVRLSSGKTKRKGGALQHLINVFVRYPSTPWAPVAGKKARKVESLLKEKWGITVNLPITEEQWATIEKAQFREARVLFNQNQFEKASEAFIEVLNLFPERPSSVRALSSLATCYIELDDELMVDTVIRYLAERFAHHSELMLAAGDTVLSLGYAFNEKGMPAKEQLCYETFFDHFRKHPRTAGELYRFGDKEFSTENYDGALTYYEQIVEDHAGTPQYYRALSKIGRCYAKQGEHGDEIKVLNRLIKELKAKERPGHQLVGAMFRFATALNSMGRTEKKPKLTAMAIKRYAELEKMLLDPEQRAAYENSPEEAKSNLTVLQGAMFYRAMADVTRKSVSEDILRQYEKQYKRKVPEARILRLYKKNAIKTLTKLVDTFPESAFAPASLSQIATIYTVLGGEDAGKAVSEVLKRLERDYPDSPEAENATYMIAIALLEMGMRNQAITKFREMFAGSGQFSASQILVAARELLKAGEYELALEGFERVLKDAKDKRSLTEPARLGKAKCLSQGGKDKEAVAILESILADYPKSGYTVEICEFMAKSYAQLAKVEPNFEARKLLFNKAVGGANRAKRFVTGPGPKARLSVVTANLLAVKAEAEETLGDAARAKEFRGQAISAYQLMILATPPFDAETRPHVEQAYAECLPLMLAGGYYDAAIDSGTQYIEQYPRGPYLSEVRRAVTRATVAGGSAERDDEVPVPEADGPTTDDNATTTEPATAATPED